MAARYPANTRVRSYQRTEESCSRFLGKGNCRETFEMRFPVEPGYKICPPTYEGFMAAVKKGVEGIGQGSGNRAVDRARRCRGQLGMG